jgi:hypothetical protein
VSHDNVGFVIIRVQGGREAKILTVLGDVLAISDLDNDLIAQERS